jgi:hypothetical protein
MKRPREAADQRLVMIEARSARSLSVDSALGFFQNAHGFREFGKLAADFEQLLLFDDASATRLSHRFFEGGLPREQFKKLVD